MIVYHGSPNRFSTFDYKRIRTNGTTEGVGFYFTDKKDVAKAYANGGYLYTVDLNGKKPLSDRDLTLTEAEIRAYFIKLDKYTGFLENYGETAYSGLETVLNRAVQIERSVCLSDADLLGSAYNATGQNEKAITCMVETLGYDHIIAKPEWGNGQTLYIALTNDIIKIVSLEKCP